MIAPQYLIVAWEPPDIVAGVWEQLTNQAPDVFNAWFVLAPGRGQDD